MPFEHYTVSERFLRYVQIDTQSDPDSTSFPSTEKQKNLGKLLVNELQKMGIIDAHLDDFGYVYGTIPSNTSKNVPVICYCSHMDTAPDCSGTNVKPLIHYNYQGQDIPLPNDPTQVLRFDKHPDLKNQIGHDIITASGKTLLGADDKAGVAEIMDAAYQLMKHPEIKHGPIRILFTPDEEIGKGTHKVDMEKLGADFGYTLDGEKLGSLEDETFSADGVVIAIEGLSAHPGFAKGHLESAIKIGSEIIAALPKDRLSPETTSHKEGFIHPVHIEGIAEKATIEFIIRDFTEEGLIAHEKELEQIMREVMKKYPSSNAQFIVKEQYRNMKKVLDKYPQVVANAEEAMRRVGITPIRNSIRGGTDGSRLSFMGLPCPNIFAGGHAFHSKLEWVSIQDMERAVDTLVNLAMVWEERS